MAQQPFLASFSFFASVTFNMAQDDVKIFSSLALDNSHPMNNHEFTGLSVPSLRSCTAKCYSTEELQSNSEGMKGGTTEKNNTYNVET
jgi:hypothetical protein